MSFIVGHEEGVTRNWLPPPFSAPPSPDHGRYLTQPTITKSAWCDQHMLQSMEPTFLESLPQKCDDGEFPTLSL